MLHDFLTSNRDELIRRCNGKVSRRASPPSGTVELEHGVPLFLGQLVEALRYEETNSGRKHDGIFSFPTRTAASVESTRTAALHGKALLEQGYTVDQVVHGYGDVCQAITELAQEKSTPVTVEEFHTLNRLLDNAIADAVSSYGHHRESISVKGAQDMHDRMGTLVQELSGLLDTAQNALEAIKAGNIGLKGATGTLLEQSLAKLRELVDKSIPGLRRSSGIKPPAGGG